MKLHTFSVYVEDRPGVLNRVASLFRRRGFNIDSITVGHTENEGLSRMTIVVDGAQAPVEQVEKQLYKLIDVVKVPDLTREEAVSRELALIKVVGRGESRVESLRIADIFRARAVDSTTESFVFEMTGSTEKIEAFVNLMKPLGLVDVARTGVVAIARGVKGL